MGRHRANWSPLKFEPDFNGPRKNRSCTDILCLLLFVVFLVAWGFIGMYAYKTGDITTLTVPVDSYRQRCGKDADVKNKTFLFFFDMSVCLSAQTVWDGCKTPQVCVSKCPDYFWIADVDTTYNQVVVNKYLICVSDAVKAKVIDLNSLKSAINNNLCARYYFPLSPIANRCIQPNLSQDNINKLAQLGINTTSILQDSTILKDFSSLNEIATKILQDFEATWRYLVMGLLLAMVVSLVYIFLLRFFAGIIVWLSILGLIILLGCGAYFGYSNYTKLQDPNFKVVPEESTNLKQQVSKLLNTPMFWMVLGIFCVIVLVLIAFIVIFLRSRISIAVTLIKEGSKAVGNTISSLFFPIIPWCLQLAVILWAAVMFLYLYASGSEMFKVFGLSNGNCICTNYKDNDTCTIDQFKKDCHQINTVSDACIDAGCGFFSYQVDNLLLYLHLINLFGMFWGIWFVSGLNQMILSSTFATWYWTFKKRNVPFFAVTEAIARVVWYHMGTIAFGSLILAICSFIRAMIEFAEQKLKKYDNPVTKAILCCAKCFFWCLHKFLCFINRNAYIMCAIHGKNFCASAKDAFQLLMRNVIRVVFVDKVTDFLFFLGKMVITIGMMVLSYFVFVKPSTLRLLDNSSRDVQLNYPWFPLAVVGFTTYIVASLFFSVYSVAVDTLFLCFLEDCERNDGSSEKPYFMSKELMRILNKKNVKPNKIK
uniref:Choline transporter-like protein n=1 Tax=Clastoptera arizonana TaxID=38151 RepID=A0A1B6ECV3_9HEMI